ncbi:hypothetical protein [Serratia symbiotica]|uniref:hypothetical protein n=1 Tax=Serratia symbiotica TaxID=138074 RepID=UPI00155A1E1A|nr:hypothetical protein [Serratia symbiotica]
MVQPANITEQANRPAPVAARLEGTAIRIHPSHSLGQECYSGGEEKADNVKLLLQTKEKQCVVDWSERAGVSEKEC